MILVTLFSLSFPDVLDVYDDTTPVIIFLQQQRQKKKTFSNLIVSKRERRGIRKHFTDNFNVMAAI
jgi:hypothetical protein